MAKIHISTYVKDPINLASDILPEQLEACAKGLQAIARHYNKVAKFLKEKEIKVTNTDGDAHCGYFEVDEIDTGRLLTSKLISDNNKESNDSVFFMDSKLDKLLEDSLQNPEFQAKVLSETLGEEEEEEEEPDKTEMSFNKETKDFIFKCSSCEEIHSQDLDTVYDNLRSAKMMLQGLSETRDSEDDPVADEADDAIHGLGFLQYLLESEYGCGKCTCDHEDEDEEVDEDDEE